MGKYFGTDGFRGEANEKLKVEQAFLIGRYLGWHFGQNKKARVVIGKDTRRSSYMFEAALSAGLTASGADVYLLHVTTTPSVSYVTRTEHFDCGIMISASHNPFYDNGIKLLQADGAKMDEGVEAAIEAYLDGKGNLPYATREQIGRIVDYAAGRNRYIGHLISLATRSFKGKRIGLDCANGSTFAIAKSVFDALGAETYVIANGPDGTNINEKCGSTHMEGLRQFVVKEGLDVGFAFDGDGDRCLAVDENGTLVDGDGILYICGKYLKEQGQLPGDTLVATVMSNYGLRLSCEQAGISLEETEVGDRNVYERMQASQSALGGERSGHLIFRKYATTGDGILTSLMLMEVMLEKKESLSSLAEGLVFYPQILQNVPVRNQRKILQDPALQEEIRRIEKELEGKGRILVRSSGTEPVLRIMVEGEKEDGCRDYADRVAARIKAADSVDTNS